MLIRYYNTYHIKILKRLKIPYEVVGDTKMIYDDVISSCDIFGYMKKLYKMREKNKYVKPVLNCTWGNLSRKKNYTVSLYDFDEKKHGNKIVQVDIQNKTMLLQSESRPYKHVTARIKSFLLAFGRFVLLDQIILDLEEKGFNIYQINTDGFITNATEKEMDKIYDVNDKLGSLKLSKSYLGGHVIKSVHDIEAFSECDDSVLDFIDEE